MRNSKQDSLAKSSLCKDFTFDSFISCDTNTFVLKMAVATAKNLGKFYNPFLIYGECGVGKTHLAQAIGNYILEHTKKAKVCYVTAENLNNEFATLEKEQKTELLKDKYENLDVLILDDLQFLQEKPELQELLYAILSKLKEKQAQIVCTSRVRVSNIRLSLIKFLTDGFCIELSKSIGLRESERCKIAP